MNSEIKSSFLGDHKGSFVKRTRRERIFLSSILGLNLSIGKIFRQMPYESWLLRGSGSSGDRVGSISPTLRGQSQEDNLLLGSVIPVLPSQRRVPEQLQLFGVLGAPMRGSMLVEWG